MNKRKSKSTATAKQSPRFDGSLSETMTRCVEVMKERGNVITRFPGGYWCAGLVWAQPTFGTSTVQALVDRGMAEYDQWYENRFPIRATLTANMPHETERRSVADER